MKKGELIQKVFNKIKDIQYKNEKNPVAESYKLRREFDEFIKENLDFLISVKFELKRIEYDFTRESVDTQLTFLSYRELQTFYKDLVEWEDMYYGRRKRDVA